MLNKKAFYFWNETFESFGIITINNANELVGKP